MSIIKHGRRSSASRLLALLMTLVLTTLNLVSMLPSVVFAQASPEPTPCPTWQTRAPMPTARFAAAGGVVNGNIWVLGGSTNPTIPPSGVVSTVEMYNPISNTWAPKQPLCSPRLAAADATQGDFVYVVGGNGGSGIGPTDTVIAYNTIDESSTVIGQLTVPRARTDADIVNNKIYIAGGRSSSGILNTIEEFDLSTGTSTMKTTLPESRDLPEVIALNGKLYILGGFDTSGTAGNNCWEYDPTTNIVTEKAPMPIARAGHKGAIVINGKIHVGGGVISNGPPFTMISDVQVYDPATNTWATADCTAPPTPRWGFEAEFVNGAVYVIGGSNNTEPLSVNEVALLGLPAQVPLTPTNLTSTAGDGYVDLSWNPSSSATGYYVYWGTSQGVYPNRYNVGTATSQRINGLSNGIRYYFAVTARNTAGESGYSNEVSSIYLSKPTINGPATSNDETVRLYGTADRNVSVSVYGAYNEIESLIGTAYSDNEGNWNLATSPPLSSGPWSFSAITRSSSQSSQRSDPITVLVSPNIPEVGDSTALSSGTTYAANPETGITEATVIRGASIELQIPVSNNPQSVTIWLLGQSQQLYDPDGDGVYTGTIPPLSSSMGLVPVIIEVIDSLGYKFTQPLMDIKLIDPSGYVYDYYHPEIRIKGAKVTLYRYNPETSTFEQMDPVVQADLMSPRVNPLYTNDEGRYGWDVAPGEYKVHVNKEGYYETWSNEVTIVDTPVTDLNVALRPIAPVAKDNSVTTAEDTPIGVTLDATYANIESLSYSIVSGSSYGTLSPIVGNKLTYIPNANFNGTDSFTYKASDGSLASNIATVSITVNPVNDAPVVGVYNTNISVNEGQVASNSGTWFDIDTGDTVTLSASIGTVIKNTNGTWSWSFDAADGPIDSQEVEVTATDLSNSTGTAKFNLTVNNVAPTIGQITAPVDPVRVNTPITATASFSDPGKDTHSAVFNWGDETTTVVAATNGLAEASHTYTQAGVYIITVTVMDDDGGRDESTYQQYIVVYDPEGGFVTGGGWINSPKGAYIANPDLTGKITFGFVSKYQKGADIPTGNTEFQFHAAKMNFKSTSYEWLVIAGAKAQYKGEGTINGAGSYGLMLTAIDGQISGGGETDRFRIKIWDKKTGSVVYDNQMDAEVTSDPTTMLSGGSIVIHKQ